MLQEKASLFLEIMKKSFQSMGRAITDPATGAGIAYVALD